MVQSTVQGVAGAQVRICNIVLKVTVTSPTALKQKTTRQQNFNVT